MAKQQDMLLTSEGIQNYENELEHLKTVVRKEVAEKIKVARSFGDLSENSEYDEAKNEQAKVEARISEIENILKHAKIIDESELTDEHIHIGSKVKVHDFDFDEDAEYQIIGSGEADPFNNKLSDESPVGAALLGHKVGDIVIAETPNGEMKFKILEISR